MEKPHRSNGSLPLQFAAASAPGRGEERRRFSSAYKDPSGADVDTMVLVYRVTLPE
jgi:hypothetical protein